MYQKGPGTLGTASTARYSSSLAKLDAQGEQAHPGMQRFQARSWGTTSREGVKAEDLSLREKGRHRGWMRNKDQVKHGFEKHTLLLKLGWGHPRFESSYAPVPSALAFAQLLIKCD